MLDSILREQLRSDHELAGMLAEYDGHPAVFYQKAPPDTDRAWEKPCYPRVDYELDMRFDPERKISGVLTINIWCSSESKFMPEDIGHRLLTLINGSFYSTPDTEPEIQMTTAAIWNRSDSFVASGSGQTSNTSEPEMYGETVTFDLTEFPPQITTDPDPVQGLNAWTYNYFPRIKVIAGLWKTLPAVWRPTDMNPAVYWRFIGADADNRQSYAVNWYNGQFAAHVIADTVVDRNRWIKALVEKIQVDGEVILPDDSPMLAQRITIRHAADPIRDGQILLQGRYGVLAQHRKEWAQFPLNNAIYPNLNMEVRYAKRK